MAAVLALGINRPGELTWTAVAALEDGEDSQSLRLLASLAPLEWADAPVLASKALEEIRVPVPERGDAVKWLAREVAAAITEGTTSPDEGAKCIWRLTLLVSDERFPELDSFVYAASEWDDRPTDRDAFAEGIVRAAAALVR